MKLLYTFLVSAVLALVSATSRRRQTKAKNCNKHDKNQAKCEAVLKKKDHTHKCVWMKDAIDHKCVHHKAAAATAQASVVTAPKRRRRHH